MTVNQKRAGDRIAHILEACQHIVSDVGDLGKQQFLADGKPQRAVIESIVVIGEASRKGWALARAASNVRALSAPSSPAHVETTN